MRQGLRLIHNFLFLFVILVSLCSFSFSAEKTWKRSTNSVYIWTDSSSDFSWEGNTVGIKNKFAHGYGTIIYNGNNKRENITLYFGAKESDFKETSDKKNKYLCENIPLSGLGIVIKTNQIETGNFRDNQLNGVGEIFDKKNERLIYSGEFVSGKSNGFGTQYQGDGAVLSGRWTNNEKQGAFTIDFIGKHIEVVYTNNIPDRSNCKIIYPDGSVWQGPVDEKYEPNGTGKHTYDGYTSVENVVSGWLSGEQKKVYPNGNIYEGTFINSKRDGYGIYTQTNGIIYDGYWKDDLFDDFGDLIISEDSYYSGEWKDGLPNGEGIYVASSFIYDGEWKNGKKDGYGILSFGGISYDGQWKDDEISGSGTVYFPDDSFYEGLWEHSKRNGYGEYIWADGRAYYGEWEDDLPNGNGTIVSASGNTYSGEIEYGFLSGAGVYTYANGDRYEGTFVENLKSGVGNYYFANGNNYEGEFLNDKPNGNGKFYFTDGTYYEGKFRDGELSGFGSLYIPEGVTDYTIISSEFWSGNIFPVKGSVLFANGDEFVGTLENGTPTKDGIWITREERLAGRTNSQKLRDFYSDHKQTIDKVFNVAETVVLAINAAATAVEIGAAVVTFFFPVAAVVTAPIAVVAMAVDKVCDVTSAAIAGTNIAIKTAAYSYDVNELKESGNEEQLAQLTSEYLEDIKWDGINVAATVGLSGIQYIKAGRNAKKALEIFPELANAQKAITKIGETAKIAKSGRFTDRLVRGVTSVAYGRVGQQLVRNYGDDAAKLLFKYGDNAFNALTAHADEVMRILGRHGEKALKPIFDYGDDAIQLITKNGDLAIDLIAKHGKSGIRLAGGTFGNDFIRLYAEYGDDFVNLIRKLGEHPNNINALLRTITNNGDDVYKTLLEISKRLSAADLNKAAKYLEAAGLAGLNQLKRWNGKVPAERTFRQISILRRINNSPVKKQVQQILAKASIKLTKQELDDYCAIFSKLEKAVQDTTGKSFREGFQEFFIRLAKEDPDAVKKIWEVQKDNIKRNGIRSGGVHEWLMAKNFPDFLTNPKWGNDGPYLAKVLTKFVQKTENFKFKNGGFHGGSFSTQFHNRLSGIIDGCQNVPEVYEKILQLAKDTLVTECYEQTLAIFSGQF